MTENIVLALKRKPLPSKEVINYAAIKVLTDAVLFNLVLPILSKAPITKTPDGYEFDRHIDSLGDGFVMAFMDGLVNAVNRANDGLWNEGARSRLVSDQGIFAQESMPQSSRLYSDLMLRPATWACPGFVDG
jgi:hypothetical protein